MSYVEIIILAVGLSMDAFAAAISRGLCIYNLKKSHAFVIALFFGGFQCLMPFVGWILGTSFAKYITFIDHWIAFILLVVIGGKMIVEALEVKDIECCDTNAFDIKKIFILAIATSIDALAIGVTLALMPNVSVVSSALIIGIITFIISYIGVFIGHKFGTKFEKASEIFGGIILIIIGFKILIEHLFFG